MPNIGFGEILLILVALLIWAPTIQAIIDIVLSEFRYPVNKIVWVLVVLFLPLVGPLLYWLMSASQKRPASQGR